jgi:hypothetical protein
LPRLERDEPAEHVEEVQQVLGVFGEPAVGLNLFQRRGRRRSLGCSVTHFVSQRAGMPTLAGSGLAASRNRERIPNVVGRPQGGRHISIKGEVNRGGANGRR